MFVHWILSLPATKFYEPKVNSFCKGKLLMKINKVERQLWEKPIYKLLSCFRKQHVLSRLFLRFYLFIYLFIYFCWGEPIKRLKIIHFVHHSTPCKGSYTCAFITSFTNEQSILICRGRQYILTAHLL